jgi:hypothetical protein
MFELATLTETLLLLLCLAGVHWSLADLELESEDQALMRMLSLVQTNRKAMA